jgi:hypothetical protein
MRATLTVTVCVLALLGAAFATHRYIDRNYAQPSRDLSKMMSVRLVASKALSAYHQQHGMYPRSLSELPLHTLQWGDEGSSPSDLSSWSYASDGSSFTMTWTNVHGTELFLGGRTGEVYYSRNERR